MALNTLHNVTLSEAQISIILYTLEDYMSSDRKSNDPDLESDVDSIFEELEGTIDKHYDKIEAARKKQPKAEWQPLKCNPSEYSKTMHNFKEFLDYCESFYLPSHPDVLYPIDGLTRGELALATLSYLDLCAASDGTVSWGDGDSLDRERVRDFVINRRAIQ